MQKCEVGDTSELLKLFASFFTDLIHQSSDHRRILDFRTPAVPEIPHDGGGLGIPHARDHDDDQIHHCGHVRDDDAVVFAAARARN